MPDDLSNAGGQDHKRINLEHDFELSDWAKKFGVSPDELRRAVEAVGDEAVKVEEHLRGRRK